MLLKMAWRNTWRKKKRSLITIAALAGGVVGIVFIHSRSRRRSSRPCLAPRPCRG